MAILVPPKSGFWPFFAIFGIWPFLAKIWPKSAKTRILARSGKIHDFDLARSWPDHDPDLAKVWPRPDQTSPRSGQIAQLVWVSAG
jgi:hypothetical protein